MSTQYLKRFFKPKSIALFGVTADPDCMGRVVLNNLVEGGYAYPIYRVGDHAEHFDGVKSVAKLDDLEQMPDLAVVCSDADKIPEQIEALGKRKVKAALVLGTRLGQTKYADRFAFNRALREAAHPYGIRILGPEGMGLLVPAMKLNASYAHQNIRKGNVAYVGQSGILGTAMIDWANGQGIGFSNFLTLGGGLDVDLASVIDYLATDPYTSSLLIQVDNITNAPHFISALRAAARNKLVLVLKSNLSLLAYADRKKLLPPGVDTFDEVYDSILTSCGAVRVDSSDELFDALETLTTIKPLFGERLALVSNGMGPSAMAVERLVDKGGVELAQFQPETIEALTELTGNQATSQNPVDLNADASPEVYQKAVEILSKAKGIDALLVLHAPTQMAPSAETAEAVIKAAKRTRRNVLTSWMGRQSAIEARNLFNDAKIPTYTTPEKAADAFMHMVQHRRNQAMLKETPTPVSLQLKEAKLNQAKQMVEQAMANGRDYLRHEEVTDVLELYGFECASSFYADSISDAIKIARKLEAPIAIKTLHKDNCYPFCYDDENAQRWRDLAMDLTNPAELEHHVGELSRRVDERFGEQEHRGFAIQRMKRGYQSLQVCTGITRDPVFGPMVFFGIGGYSHDVRADRQLMMPPLNKSLAMTMIRRSRFYPILQQNSSNFEEHLDSLCQVLVRLSEMVIDLPHLRTLEIHPLLINKTGLLVVDASIGLGQPVKTAITPYPEQLESTIELRSGREVLLRPIRGEDEPRHLEFFKRLSPESIRLRYFYSRGEPNHDELANWTQIDYDREMAFIATAPRLDGKPGNETLGVVRTTTDADNVSAEFAVVLLDELQGEGLGRVLMQKMVDYCRDRGTLEIMGTTMTSNLGMQKLAKKLGFENSYNHEEEAIEMKMMLNEPTEEWQRTRLAH